MAGINNKRPRMAPQRFSAWFGQMSKAALIDALWCACQLGTDESEDQITAQAARNAVIALETRGDRKLVDLTNAAAWDIDSD